MYLYQRPPRSPLQHSQVRWTWGNFRARSWPPQIRSKEEWTHYGLRRGRRPSSSNKSRFEPICKSKLKILPVMLQTRSPKATRRPPLVPILLKGYLLDLNRPSCSSASWEVHGCCSRESYVADLKGTWRCYLGGCCDMWGEFGIVVLLKEGRKCQASLCFVFVWVLENGVRHHNFFTAAYKVMGNQLIWKLA